MVWPYPEAHRAIHPWPSAHDHPRPHLAKISTHLPEAEKVPVPAWPADSPDTCPLSRFGMFWIGIYISVFQFLPISSGFPQTTFHHQQPDHLEGEVLHCVRHQILTGSPHPPPCTTQYSKTAHLIVAFYCEQPEAHLSCCLISILLCPTGGGLSHAHEQRAREREIEREIGLLCTLKKS